MEATEAPPQQRLRLMQQSTRAAESDHQSAVTVAKLSVAVGTPSREDVPQCWVIKRSRVFSSDNRWTWGIGLFRDLERDDEVVVGGGDGGGAGGGGAQEETRGNLRTIMLQVNSKIRLLLIMKMIVVTGQILKRAF